MPRARAHRVGLFAAQQEVAAAPVKEDEFTVGSDGQTVFNLTATHDPNGIKEFRLNHLSYREGSEADFSGSVVTWLEPGGLQTKTGDSVTIVYNNI
jgi:hypothetical protein